MRVLGIDYGTSKTGLALGDTAAGIAEPLSVLRPDSIDELISMLEKIIKKEAIDRAVIGAAAQFSHDIEVISERLSIPLMQSSEAYTTSSAREYRDSYPGMEDDAIAAALILQDYFESVPGEV
jgi:RNase H-fold protein (predicted Holliday junction resolvase)